MIQTIYCQSKFRNGRNHKTGQRKEVRSLVRVKPGGRAQDVNRETMTLAPTWCMTFEAEMPPLKPAIHFVQCKAHYRFCVRWTRSLMGSLRVKRTRRW